MARIALLGATGQIGRSILLALLTTTSHEVVQLVQPASEKAKAVNTTAEQRKRLHTMPVDLLTASVDELAFILTGVSVVISALNGRVLQAQSKIQNAAAQAGVRRFYPSEYGKHHIYFGEDGYGYLHPIWSMKAQANEQVMHHPAIVSGEMTFTLIGCGEFYNQDREIHILGRSDAKIDFTHIDDLAAFLVQTIEHPEVSENRELNFVSDQISYDEIATLLERYTGKEVEKDVMPVEVLHRAWKDSTAIPDEVAGGSAFPADFWILVKGMQGLGRFWRPPEQVHNHLFPDVKVTTFERYFQRRFGQDEN
ncbi:hypothetical protein BDV25DRAFT_130240 [Aspergillus avenaceus]|uniref:NmrA-like domain-containing protein n=1 Tax=Aspergillus avenaceus TaxID=36643 RepID=A0A5N6TTC1_ASPAV|nr:hypothetical protein BDV25DRAFT_130240 [Aspergillus avenaceus]